MKRIFHLWFVCGSLDLPETYLAAGLGREGFRVTVIHSTVFSPERSAILRAAGVEQLLIPICNRLDFSASRQLRAELARWPCDIIYAPQNKALAMVLRAVRGYPAIHVIGYRGTIGHLTRWDPSSWLTYFNPRLDHVVSVSEAVRNYLVDQIRLPPGKVTRIYKGHDPAWYDSPGQTEPVPSPAERPLTLCFTGRIRPVKGVIHLLDAMKLLPATLDVQLLLVGTMADKKVARRLEQDKDPRVIVLGERRDIPAILARTDIFLMPTIKREGLARSVLEAMSRRLPCIVSDVGGLPELVVDGETGIVVPPRDPAAIAHAVERLAKDRDLRMKLGNAARERVDASFNVNATIVAFRELFMRICSTPRRR